MELERFKSNLNKGQLEAMAIDTEKKYLESTDPLEILQFAKKLLYFATEFKEEAEKEAKLVWETHKIDYPSMSYTVGGVILDLNGFDYRKKIADHLKSVDEQIKRAYKTKDPVFIASIITGEIISVPKVKMTGARKDSINVKI